MKHIKKMMALALAMVMMLAMAVPAMAATITITQDATTGTEGAETYDLYKIFDVKKTSAQANWEQTDDNLGDVDTADDDYKGFSYTISTSNPWLAKLWNTTTNAAQSGQTWVTLTQSAGDTSVYNVTWVGAQTEAAAIAFADWLLANKGTITPDKTMTSSAGTATNATVDDGYYLVKSSLGTNLVLATSNINITTKNDYVTDDKTVAKTNYNVGDMVPYTITVNLPASIDYTKPVTVHDTMDDVLALDTTSVHAKVTADNDFDSHMTLVQSANFATGHSATHAAATGKTLFDFVLDISSLAPAAGTEPTAKTITITYEAELLSTAAADTGYVNEEFTEYSKYETTPNDVTVKTYDFDLKKVFTGNTDKALQATFNLYPSTTSGKADSPLTFIDGGTVTGKDRTYVKVDSNDGAGSADIIVSVDTTNKSLVTNVRGLAAGTYYLTETATADGYNLLTTDIVVTIDAEGNATIDAGELFTASDSTITVTNNSGSVLPSTGGIGTTIFYVIGAILVLGAGVLLVTRRRMNSN